MEINLDTVSQMIEGNQGFHKFLNMKMLEYSEENAVLTIGLPFKDDYARLPSVGDYHGGILASAMDVAGTFACMMKCGRVTPTMNLRIDYLKPAVKCDLRITAEVVRAGRNSAVADVKAQDAEGTLYAVARGGWAVMNASKE